MSTSSSSSIARLGTSCLIQTLLFAAVAAANHRLLTPAVADPRLRVGFALVSALFLSVGLGSFWSLARGHGRGEASRGALLRRARSGEPPPDGGPVVATGSVRSLAAPLIAPLSQVPCVAYTYRMYRVGRQSGGDRTEEPVYWGHASRPFAVDGATSRARVLAVPHLLSKARIQTGTEVIERARRLVNATPFEEVQWSVFGVVGTAFATAREIFTDEDGEARRDWRRAGDDTDPSILILEEAVLPVGGEASVHGTWSAERGAIVAQGDPTTALGVSAALGPPENLGDTLPHSTVAYMVTATISTLLGAGLVWFALKILPALV